MSNSIQLSTDRLCLSQFLWSDPNHCQFLAKLETTLRIPNGRPGKAAIRTSDDAKQSLYHDNQVQWNRYGYGTYLILIKTSPARQITEQNRIDPQEYEPIGKIVLTTWDASEPIHATELFVSILPEHQRRGYATEATRALLEFVKSQFGLAELFAFAMLDTPYTGAARAFARKLGFRERGLGRRFHSDGLVFATLGMRRNVFLSMSTPITSDGDLMDVD
ncbi:acyl-CoA N-acyltransferase [Aspergillus pseudodeflectus]|uniref:Acyl-CoA N-acyltransferase n=1 Tax=Aspergillus pseudodeflectus TaxID=176178 RepID=A0ABR4JV50_9EURO